MTTKYVETEKVYSITEELWVKFEANEVLFFNHQKNPVYPRVIGRSGFGYDVIFSTSHD